MQVRKQFATVRIADPRGRTDRCLSIYLTKGGTMTQETSSNRGQIVLELELRPLGGWGDEPEELPPFAVALDVSLQDAAKFPDVVELLLELDIDENDESDDASAALFGQVVDFVNQWLQDNQVQPTDEIQTAVENAFLVLDAHERSTESQIEKFDQFNQLLYADEIIDGLLQIVSCTEVAEEDLGETWGITLLPEENVLARVHVGSRMLAEVRESGLGVVFQIMVIGEVDIPEFVGTSAFMSPGFEDVAGSMMVSVVSAQLFDLLDSVATENQIAAHAAICVGRLPRTNMHNPMSEILIFSVEE